MFTVDAVNVSRPAWARTRRLAAFVGAIAMRTVRYYTCLFVAAPTFVTCALADCVLHRGSADYPILDRFMRVTSPWVAWAANLEDRWTCIAGGRDPANAKRKERQNEEGKENENENEKEKEE